MATLEQRVAALEARHKAARAAPIVADDMSSWLQFVSDDDLVALEALCSRAAERGGDFPEKAEAAELTGLQAIATRTLEAIPPGDEHAGARAALQALSDAVAARMNPERSDEGS